MGSIAARVLFLSLLLIQIPDAEAILQLPALPFASLTTSISGHVLSFDENYEQEEKEASNAQANNQRTWLVIAVGRSEVEH